MNDKNDCAANLLRKLKHTLPLDVLCFFSDEKNFRLLSDGKHTEQPLVCSILNRCTNIDENQTPSTHYGVWSCH